MLKGLCLLGVLVSTRSRAAEVVTLTDPLPSAVTGVCTRTLLAANLWQVQLRTSAIYIPRCPNIVKQAKA